MIAKQGQSQAIKFFDILSLIFALYIYKLIIPKYKAIKIFDILSLIFALYIYKLIIPKYKAIKIFDILSFNSSNIL